jgi:hypothetical protein
VTRVQLGSSLPRAIVDTDTRVRDLAFAIVWNVFAVDENNGVGAFDDSGYALSKTPEFFWVGFAP